MEKNSKTPKEAETSCSQLNLWLASKMIPMKQFRVQT